MGSSFSHRSFKSVTRADMPETKHCFPAMLLISRMASMVRSEEVEVSKNTAIMVALSVLNALYSCWGSSSMGADRSSRESYHRTVSTWSTFSIRALRAAASLLGISSRIIKENAPLPKSSSSSFWPTTVSMSAGR